MMYDPTKGWMNALHGGKATKNYCKSIFQLISTLFTKNMQSIIKQGRENFNTKHDNQGEGLFQGGWYVIGKEGKVVYTRRASAFDDYVDMKDLLEASKEAAATFSS